MPNLNTLSPRDSFLRFSAICAEESPLYGALAGKIADDPDVLALSTGGQAGQPPPNLLLGAVQFLLLSGVEHELATFYPSLGGRASIAEAWPGFADFCRCHARKIAPLVRTRRIQTNEVGRCGVLLPAFSAAHDYFRRPLHLIELGASAGLTLLFDRYRYAYSDGRSAGRASSAVIRCELRGPHAPASIEIPPVANRTGVDLAPLDVTDIDAMRWLEALIWPDHVDRIELFRDAVKLARTAPPRIIRGDGMEIVPTLVETTPADQLPCVFHSHAIYQMTAEWRAEFYAILDKLGRRRDLMHISLEWLGDDAGPQLNVMNWQNGRSRCRRLAACHHHGRWMAWNGDPAIA